jgi:hypothetical protein
MPTAENICKAWVKVSTPAQIFKKSRVAQVKLATSDKPVPTIYKSFKDFIKNEEPLFAQLSDVSAPAKHTSKSLLSEEQKILTGGLVAMLKGLGESDKDVSEAFAQRGLGDLLQYSYFRINNAFREAILRRDDLLEFQKALDVVSLEIQMILSIVEPYGPDALNQLVVNRLQGEKGIIRDAQLELKAYAQPSAMRCLSTLLSSIQSQNGDKPINALIQKFCYYESSNSMVEASGINSSIFDGDKFNLAPDEALAEVGEGIELFLCEFHHNISTEKQSYAAENVIGQIKELLRKGKTAQPLHVVIDSTLNLELSEDFEKLFNDPEVSECLASGKLSITLLRSAQKFDMLGFDNYYGGVATVVNNGKDFEAFNKRMGRPGEQLHGGNYQGLCHLYACASDQIEDYRRAIMKNTVDLYKLLPEKVLAAHQGPVQVSEILDDTTCYLDVRFDSGLYPSVHEQFQKYFCRYCQVNQLPLTTRQSFGYANSNLVVIDESGKQMRISIGLEDRQCLECYAKFFEEFQDTIDQFSTENEKLMEEMSVSRKQIEENVDVLKNRIELLLSAMEESPDNKKAFDFLNGNKGYLNSNNVYALENLARFRFEVIKLKEGRREDLNFEEICLQTVALIKINLEGRTIIKARFLDALAEKQFANRFISSEEMELILDRRRGDEKFLSLLNAQKKDGMISFPLSFKLVFNEKLSNTSIVIEPEFKGKSEDDFDCFENEMTKFIESLPIKDALIPVERIKEYKNIRSIKIGSKIYCIDQDLINADKLFVVISKAIDVVNDMVSEENFMQIRSRKLNEIQKSIKFLEENGMTEHASRQKQQEQDLIGDDTNKWMKIINPLFWKGVRGKLSELSVYF